MKGQDPRELFNAFRGILRDATFCPHPDPYRDFDSVLKDLKTRVMEHAADELRVIDQDILNSNLDLVSDAALDAVAAERRAAGLPEISRRELRANELERFAVLNPIELLSFPHPEIRATLVSRFGPNSSIECLRDIFDLDQDEVVRTEVVSAAHRRLTLTKVSPAEESRIIAFGNSLVKAAFSEGRDVDAGHVALAMIRHHPEGRLPDVLSRVHTARWPGGPLDHLSPVDRSGVVRFFGDRMTAPDLLDYLEKEWDLETVELLLQKLDLNWDLGVAPDGYGTDVDRTKVSRFALGVLTRKLGVEDPSLTLLEDLLYTDSQPGEPSVYQLMRRLAARAFRESGM